MSDPQNKERKETLILGVTILTALLMAFLVSLYVVSFGVVAGESMSGTLEDGDLILISKTDKSYKIGDVVVFKSEELTKGTVVKRIAAVSGDHVKITAQGEFYLNSEYVLTFSARYTEMDRTLPAEEYFLLGDNEAESLDSRSEEFPKVTQKDIVGKVKYRLFPKIEKVK